MTNEDKRLIIESVGLEYKQWIKHWDKNESKITYGYNLDPLDPADMFGKIIPAFKEMGDCCWLDFIISTFDKQQDGWKRVNSADLLTSAPDLAQAMLEFFKEKENPCTK